MCSAHVMHTPIRLTPHPPPNVSVSPESVTAHIRLSEIKLPKSHTMPHGLHQPEGYCLTSRFRPKLRHGTLGISLDSVLR